MVTETRLSQEAGWPATRQVAACLGVEFYTDYSWARQVEAHTGLRRVVFTGDFRLDGVEGAKSYTLALKVSKMAECSLSEDLNEVGHYSYRGLRYV